MYELPTSSSELSEGFVKSPFDPTGSEMILHEKTNLLHGGYVSFAARIIFGAVFKGSMFYLPFLGGGCRRLGIPRYFFSDGPKGAVTGHGTCFPSAMMRESSFDTELEYRIGTAMAKEVNWLKRTSIPPYRIFWAFSSALRPTSGRNPEP